MLGAFAASTTESSAVTPSGFLATHLTGRPPAGGALVDATNISRSPALVAELRPRAKGVAHSFQTTWLTLFRQHCVGNQNGPPRFTAILI